LTKNSYGYIFKTEKVVYPPILKTMPRFDGTGPLGYGPATGRGVGPCFFGGGRGWYGRRFISKGEEAEMLKEEMKDLENELQAVKERLSELEGQK